MGAVLAVAGLFILWAVNSLRILNEYERAVIFRLGRVQASSKGPGFVFVIWPIDRAVVVNMQLVAFEVPAQDIITRDNVSAKVNAVVYYRVVNPVNAIVEVQNYNYATSQMAQTTLRSVLGEMELDSLLQKREQINERLQSILDSQTDPWGIKVSHVEMKQVDLQEQLRHAMARQAEAERERRAKVISAEGEFQAAAKICEAAEMMQKYPMALQLRYLQTLVEIGSKNNTTTLFPIPIDLIKAFLPKNTL